MDLGADSWAGRQVLVTGHTGFKGVWLSQLLIRLGAKVIGVSLPISPDDKLYLETDLSSILEAEYFFNLESEENLEAILESHKIDYVFHLAAQALVLESFKTPKETIATNVMGTVNTVLAALNCPSIRGILVVTTDKVYENLNEGRLFKEDSKLGGHDPYSASKAACEIVVSALAKSCNPLNIPVATARAGNVLGGGDFNKDRLIPDIYASLTEKTTLSIRNPKSTRPFQHVLDCLAGYILIANYHGSDSTQSPMSFNFGPDFSLSVEEVLNTFFNEFSTKANFQVIESNAIESKSLALDSSFAKIKLGWKARYEPEMTVRETANWYRLFSRGESARDLCDSSISSFLEI